MKKIMLAWMCIGVLLPVTVRSELITDVRAPVREGSPLTWRQLAEGVFPGLSDDGQAGLVLTEQKVLRRPGVKERTILPEGAHVSGFEAASLTGGGQRFVLLLMSVEDADTEVPGGAAVLAVFREGEAEPRDVVELKSDLFTSLGGPPFLQLGADEAFTITNSHFNSNQGYQDAALFHIHKERIRRIASVFTLTVRGMCERSFSERALWRTLPDPGNVYPRVLAEVTLTRGAEGEDAVGCPKARRAAPPAAFSEEYRWDKAGDRFVRVRSGMGALDQFNKDKF